MHAPHVGRVVVYQPDKTLSISRRNVKLLVYLTRQTILNGIARRTALGGIDVPADSD